MLGADWPEFLLLLLIEISRGLKLLSLLLLFSAVEFLGESLKCWTGFPCRGGTLLLLLLLLLFPRSPKVLSSAALVGAACMGM